MTSRMMLVSTNTTSIFAAGQGHDLIRAHFDRGDTAESGKAARGFLGFGGDKEYLSFVRDLEIHRAAGFQS